MRKFAFKYTKPRHATKLFRLMSEREIASSAIRQRFPRVMQAIIFRTSKYVRSALPQANRMLVDAAREIAPNTGGTIYSDNSGKKFVGISRDFFRQIPKKMRREVIAHEAFHAKNPLGASEILAHAYGGYRGGGITGGAKSLLHLGVSRPDRLAAELTLVGGAASVPAAAYVLAKKRLERKKDNK